MRNRIDFQVVFSVENANPNGDPIDGNRPRQLANGKGEMTDVCIKRKLRNRLSDLGENILIKSSDQCNGDEPNTVVDRYHAAVNDGKKMKGLTDDDIRKGLESFIDVRLFGQVYSFIDKSSGEHTNGAVSITSAFSAEPIEIRETQITKSISNTSADKKGSDTMGMKYSVPFAVYSFFGSISGHVAEENLVSDHDIELLKQALCTLFENDASTARPYGSMNVERVIWYEHDSVKGQVRPDVVKNALSIRVKDGKKDPESLSDYDIELLAIPNLKTEIIDKPW